MDLQCLTQYGSASIYLLIKLSMLLMDMNYKIVVDHGKEGEQKYLNIFDVMSNYSYINNIYRYTYNPFLIILPYFSG